MQIKSSLKPWERPGSPELLNAVNQRLHQELQKTEQVLQCLRKFADWAQTKQPAFEADRFYQDKMKEVAGKILFEQDKQAILNAITYLKEQIIASLVFSKQSKQ